ncbi:glycosyltransferase [bacterium]|nr:glycosyltransferase [bacterium]
MTQPRTTIPVSLILTTKNEAEHIPLFFRGVRSATVLPAEIVICDGGSSDDTVEVIRREQNDLPVTVIVENGANIARGRNCAIAAAQHDILAITDAGCIIDEHWLERITEDLLADEAVHAVGGGYELIGDTFVQRCTAAASIPLSLVDKESFLPSSRSFAARRQAILDAGGYPEELTFAGEDTALVLRMKALGQRFLTRWDAMVQWYTRPTFRGFLRQHRLYGLGDGEAGSHQQRYIRSTLKWILLLAITISGVFFPPLLVLVPLLLFLYFLYLTPKYEWGKRPIFHAFGGFLFVALKEWSMLTGYVQAKLRGRKGGAA